ncbi:hypothetical protein XENOCAPTIV_011924, partial [Xenoophorus captivus]
LVSSAPLQPTTSPAVTTGTFFIPFFKHTQTKSPGALRTLPQAGRPTFRSWDERGRAAEVNKSDRRSLSFSVCSSWVSSSWERWPLKKPELFFAFPCFPVAHLQPKLKCQPGAARGGETVKREERRAASWVTAAPCVGPTSKPGQPTSCC